MKEENFNKKRRAGFTELLTSVVSKIINAVNRLLSGLSDSTKGRMVSKTRQPKMYRFVTQSVLSLMKGYRRANKLAYILPTLIFLIIAPNLANAQWMKIDQNGGNPVPTAALEISDTSRGFLPPRLTETQMNAISSPASGLLIFNTSDSTYKYFNGDGWVVIQSGMTSSLDSVLASGSQANRDSILNLGYLAIGVDTVSGSLIYLIDTIQSASGYHNSIYLKSNGTATTGATQSGIYSEILGSDGENIAVDGTSGGTSSGTNTGIGGYAYNATNINRGVYGYSRKGSNSIGVYGNASQGTGINYGVYGTVTDTSSTSGNRGVFGQVNGKGAWNEGVSGFSTGSNDKNNTGVYGQASGSSVTNTAIGGNSSDTTDGTNYGIAVIAANARAWNIGVRGYSQGFDTAITYGTYGQAAGTGYIKRGIVGVISDVATSAAQGQEDAAVYGIASSTGSNTAVFGRARMSNPSDTNRAFWAQAEDGAVNYSGYFESGNLLVNDTLILTNGAGANQVLTSDSNGYATWQSPNAGAKIIDADSDTWVETDSNGTDNDQIRMYLNSIERYRFTNGRLEIVNNDGMVAIGSNAGASDTKTGIGNTYFGNNAGASVDTAIAITAIGNSALANTTVDYNTAIGYAALNSNVSGKDNVAVGDFAARFSTSSGITAIGSAALYSNTVGSNNTAMGRLALFNNTSGNNNIAIGPSSMRLNDSGSTNIAIGINTMFSNTGGGGNIAIGTSSMNVATNPLSSVAIGVNSLQNSNSPYEIVAVGYRALANQTSGSYNVALGFAAGEDNLTGSGNVFLGHRSGQGETGSNRLYIDNDSSSTPLIYGEFDTDKLTLNGKVMLGNGFTGALSSSNTNQLNILSGIDVNGNTNGIRFLETAFFGMSFGYDGSGFGDTNFLAAYNSSGNSIMAFQNGGHVGIGTTTPAELLTLANGGNLLFIDSTSNDPGDIIFQTSAGAQLGRIWSFDNVFNFSSYDNTPDLSIDSTGNIGIHTTTPPGDISIISNSTNEPGLYLSGYGSSEGDIAVDASDAMQIGHYSVGTKTFTPRIHIQSDGDIGIGTTAPSAKLEVEVDLANGPVMRVHNTNTGNNADGITVQIGTPAVSVTTLHKWMNFEDGSGVDMGYVRGNAGALEFHEVSDRRRKTDIHNFNEGLAIINRIKPRTYFMKGAPEYKKVGFIAQELQLVFPNAVAGDSLSDVKDDPMTVSYSSLVPVLTRAIQEQQKMIEELQNQNATLKSENDNQEGTIQSQQNQLLEINAKLEVIQQMLNEGQSNAK